MDNFTRTKEGGSVVTFVVVGLVLAVLVIGGIYTVRRSGQEHPSSSPSPSVAVSPSATPTKSPPAASKPPAPTTKPSKSPVPTTPHTGTAPLPTTGPTDTLMSTLMLAVLVGVATSYIQSHRARLARVAADNR